uniref:Uncharacterized protein n=1 Tax=Rhizophora mucronata TaxID=61149 RepID=A0A2P2NTZ6_RHIMU
MRGMLCILPLCQLQRIHCAGLIY